MFFLQIQKEINNFLPNFVYLSKQKDRHKEIMDVKIVTSYLLLKVYRLRSTDIGKQLNVKHCTIIYRAAICETRLKYDVNFKRKYESKINEIKRCTIY
jgi:hypothetical protein